METGRRQGTSWSKVRDRAQSPLEATAAPRWAHIAEAADGADSLAAERDTAPQCPGAAGLDMGWGPTRRADRCDPGMRREQARLQGAAWQALLAGSGPGRRTSGSWERCVASRSRTGTGNQHHPIWSKEDGGGLGSQSDRQCGRRQCGETDTRKGPTDAWQCSSCRPKAFPKKRFPFQKQNLQNPTKTSSLLRRHSVRVSISLSQLCRSIRATSRVLLPLPLSQATSGLWVGAAMPGPQEPELELLDRRCRPWPWSWAGPRA